MIFITVGTTNKGFYRLIKKLDEISINSKDIFFAQIGNSSYIPKNFKYLNWLSQAEMAENYSKADIIISHAGFGTISEVLALNKPLILVPRSFESNEAVNNQFDLANKLYELGYVKSVGDIQQLAEVIKNINNYQFNKYVPNEKVHTILIDYIKSISND